MRIHVLLAVLALAAFAACGPQSLEQRVDDTRNEFLYDDVVQDGVVSLNISFFGVSIGDSEQSVLDLHGEPTRVEDYQFGRVRNLEYAFGPDNSTDVLYHADQGVVAAVLVQESAEPLLSEDTLLGERRTSIYEQLGLPTLSKDLYRERVFFYDELGYEVYVKDGVVDRIVEVQRSKEATAPLAARPSVSSGVVWVQWIRHRC